MSDTFQPIQLAFTRYDPINDADFSLAPIIYLHGLTDYKGVWEEIPQIVANATKRVSYTLDSRNHGDSEWSEEFNFDINVDDLIHFMDKLTIKKAVLVGHSMGGITTIKTALRKPDRIEKICVEDMVVRRLPQDIIDIVLAYIKALKEATEKAPTELNENDVKKFVMQHILANLPEETKSFTVAGNDDDVDTCFINLSRDASGHYRPKWNLEVIERSLQNTETLSAEPDGRFDGPTCFIYGKNSPMQVKADEDHIKHFFPKAVFEGIEDVGHNVHNDKPLEFTQILLKFLS